MTSNIRPILLVEDDLNDVELVTAALRSGNLANPLIVARDGVEALDILSKGRYDGLDADGPVVVLLDNKMPRMTGLELLRHMKSDERLKRIPVVMMTSSRAEPDFEQAYALGVNAYVVKPVDFKDFTEAVKVVGKFWAILNEPPRASSVATAR
ncbi:MAG TPA: response regulator [Terriglobales bacterium]|nr:response regulator [Terriglobales bacterium]